MVKFVAAKCPSCRADLDIDHDTKKYTCPYCGTLVLIDNDIKHDRKELKEYKEKENFSDDKSRAEIISLAKKLINKGEYDEAKDNLYEIIDNKDIEGRTLIALACCKEIESDPIYKDTCVEVGSNEINELLVILNELKDLDKNKNYLKVLSDYKDNFDEYKRIYDDKMAYKKIYDKANKMLNELYVLASKSLGVDKALEMIKSEFDIEDKRLPFLPFTELMDKGALINSKYDEFKIEIAKLEKLEETKANKNILKNIGILIVIILVIIVLAIINPWIIYFVGMLGMFGYLALVK